MEEFGLYGLRVDFVVVIKCLSACELSLVDSFVLGEERELGVHVVVLLDMKPCSGRLVANV